MFVNQDGRDPRHGYAEFSRQPNPMSYQRYGYTNTIPRWRCSGAAPVFYQNSPCDGTPPDTTFLPCA